MALTILAASTASAHAQTAAYNLSIPAKAAAESMIDLALQTNISILGAQACAGASPSLVGRFTLNQALTRLADRRCAFQIVDAKTVRLSPLSPPAPLLPRLFTRRTPLQPVAPPPAIERREAPMGEIVVTATKRDLLLGAAAASVSVVGGSDLRASNTVDTAGAASQIAGIVITNLGPGRDKILLRGLSDGAFTGRTRSTVGVYLDDSPITYNAPDPSLRLVDIDRLEVIRGPQGALYGAGSLSGVFRIVTNKPDLQRFGGEASAAYGDTLSGASSYALEGVLNAPIVAGKLGLRAVAYQAVDGGYLDDVNLRLSDVDRTLRQGGRLALAARPDSGWDVDLNAAVQHLESNDTQYVTMTSRLQRANKVREAHKNDFAQAALTVRKRFDTFRLQSSTGLVQHRFSSLYDASAALSLFDPGEADLGVYREAATVDMWAQDVFIADTTGGRFDWLLGAYGARTAEKSPSSLRGSVGRSAPVPLYDEMRRDRTLESAVYGEAGYRLAGRWTASVGGRLFQTRLRTRSDVVVPPPGVSRVTDQAKHFSGFSPKLSLQYDLGGGQTVYLLASQGYRAGGFNTSGRIPPAPTRSTYGADRLQNVELGARLRPFDSLDVSAALFYAHWQDIQTDQYFASGLAYTINVGDGRDLGLETELNWRASSRIDLSVNALLTQSKVTDVNPAFATRVGPGLPGIPKLSAGTQATYSQPLPNGASLIFGSQMRYVGRTRLTFEPGAASRMGSYVIGKVWAQYRTPRWSLAAYISNPTNSEGDTFAYGNPFSFGQVRQVTPQRPRTVMVELSKSF